MEVPEAPEPPAKKKLPVFASTTLEERQAFIDSRTPKNTSLATDFWVRSFQQYNEGKTESIDFKTCSKPALADLIEGFYSHMRKKDGTKYTRNSYMSARAALQRYLTSIRIDVNLYSSPEFQRTNKLLDGLLKSKKRLGEEPAVQHKASINDGDWDRLLRYFSDILVTRDPRKLTYYSWFHITSKFCLRGGEIQCRLTKDDLVLTTVDGKEVFKLHTGFMSKNHQGGTGGSAFASSGCIQDEIQVRVIKLYLQRLNPDLDRLFQRSKVPAGSLIGDTVDTWYMRSPLSHNLLQGFMKEISKAARVSQQYTNHCIRATTVVHLKQAGIEDRKICEISGHKNPNSLAVYDKTSPAQAVQMSAKIDFLESASSAAVPVCAPLMKSESVCVAAAPHTSLADRTNVSAPAFVLHADGATFNNVTFNVTPQRHKKKLSLQLKKTRKKAEMKKTMSTES